jgi:photosystem II stability/assembly factor-like uncharacterized protein
MPDYLTEIEEQLVALTEQGRHRRRSRGVDAVLLGLPLAVVAAVVVAVIGLGGAAHNAPAAGHHRPQRHTPSFIHPRVVPQHVVQAPAAAAPPTTPVAPPAGGPVPTGFDPTSFTATGEYTWWLLGPAPCSSPPCTSIVRTTDGGHTFVGIPAPRTTRVSQLRFADSLNGYAYGPQLWVTHDGGGTWHQLRVRGVVTDLFASDGWVYADVRMSEHLGVLARSPVDADRWTVLPGSLGADSGLWAQGREVLASASPNSALLVSHDRGEGFSRYRAPSGVGCHLESPAPPVVWAQCTQGSASGIWRSINGGRTFPLSGARPGRALLLPDVASFAAASGDTAVFGLRQLYRTTDGGTNWSAVRGPQGITSWRYLGFTDPTHGVALGATRWGSRGHVRLYYTTDGGASYHLVMIR